MDGRDGRRGNTNERTNERTTTTRAHRAAVVLCMECFLSRSNASYYKRQHTRIVLSFLSNHHHHHHTTRARCKLSSSFFFFLYLLTFQRRVELIFRVSSKERTIATKASVCLEHALSLRILSIHQDIFLSPKAKHYDYRLWLASWYCVTSKRERVLWQFRLEWNNSSHVYPQSVRAHPLETR